MNQTVMEFSYHNYQFNGEISEKNLNLNLVQGYLPTKEMHTCILWKNCKQMNLYGYMIYMDLYLNKDMLQIFVSLKH